MPSSRSGYCFPFVPPPPLSPASLVYIPLPLFGDLKAPLRPPSLLCGVQTLSPPLQRKEAAPTFLELSLDLTPTIICRSKAMSALACLRCLPSGSGFVSAGIDPRAYLAVVAKVRVLFFTLRQMNGHWREEKQGCMQATGQHLS